MSMTLFGQDVIKSISFDEGEILRSIQELHCPDWFELDPCYSIGRFYNDFGIPEPKYKFDLYPQARDVVEGNANKLPFTNQSIASIMFDPPFLAASGPSLEKDDGSNIITGRFGAYRTMEELWLWYQECILEFKRILKPNGVLIFKNQDTVSSAKNYFSHCHIMNLAIRSGMYPKDLFLVLAKHRVIGFNHDIQQHARKFHCYYWVFINHESKVNYNL